MAVAIDSQFRAIGGHCHKCSSARAALKRPFLPRTVAAVRCWNASRLFSRLRSLGGGLEPLQARAFVALALRAVRAAAHRNRDLVRRRRSLACTGMGLDGAIELASGDRSPRSVCLVAGSHAMGCRTLSGGPQLAREIITRWFNRRRPDPPRAVRIVLEINGKTFVDISSKLALAMIDCEYGKPVSMESQVPRVKITFTEVDP